MAAATRSIIAILTAAAFSILTSSASNAWEGTDSEGNTVEIESGELVRPGLDIDVYHSERGYGTYSVENINRYGSTVELEVYNNDTGEYETFEMED